MKEFWFVVMILGVIVLALTNVGSVGYGLYLWASVGLAFKTAVWKAFLVWVKLIVIGLVMYIGSAFLLANSE